MRAAGLCQRAPSAADLRTPVFGGVDRKRDAAQGERRAVGERRRAAVMPVPCRRWLVGGLSSFDVKARR